MGDDGGGGDDVGGDDDVGDWDGYVVTLELPDRTERVAVGEEEYVLDAAEADGVELPHSCRNGMCTSCVGELVDGDVDQRDGSALAPHQEDDGYVLLCSACPRADCTVRAGERVQDELLGLDAL